MGAGACKWEATACGGTAVQRPDGPTCPLRPAQRCKVHLKALSSGAGERLEHAGMTGNLGVVDHWSLLRLVVPRHHSTLTSIA